MLQDRKQRLRELLTRVPMSPAERGMAEKSVARMSGAQVENFLKRIEFAYDLAALIAKELDRLFGPEPIAKGEN